MKKVSMLLTLLSTFALGSFAQAPKPAAAKDWIDQWKDVTERVIGVAEAMPAEKYGYTCRPRRWAPSATRSSTCARR